LDTNGAFEYSLVANFVGIDSFQYVISDGYSLPSPTTVELNLNRGTLSVKEFETVINIYTNPVKDVLTIEEVLNFDELIVFDSLGRKEAPKPLY
jgi:hypothetical protein